MNPCVRLWLMATCLFVSGAAALIYEVLWSRQFALVMGSTAYALSTVISVFLGGLALGAWLGGRWTRRRGGSLWQYGVLELLIGLTAAAVPSFIRLLDPVFGLAYRSAGDSLFLYSAAQLGLCAPAMLAPAALMGATLPIATAWALRGGAEVARGVSVLYAMNTLGGVVGAGAAGFVLLPQLGMAQTGWVAVGLNVAAGLIALASLAAAERTQVAAPGAVVAVGRSGESARDAAHFDLRSLPAVPGQHEVETARSLHDSGRAGALALLYGASGFASLCLEVAWARLVGLVIGSTTYGFTIILVAFISGIGLGSLTLPRLRLLSSDPLRGVFVLHASIALAGMISVAYLGELPRALHWLAAAERGTRARMAAELLLVFATLAVPTLAMGGIFPLLAGLLHRRGSEPGHATGLAYSANTAGNILGSLVAGFVLVPAIGMRATIVLASGLSGVTGIAYLWPRLRARQVPALWQAAALAAAMAVAAVATPPWNPALITSAPFLAQPGQSLAAHAAGEVIELREGASTVVSVTRNRDGTLALYQDGVGESHTVGHLHRRMGHLPVLLHGSARTALVIGLGGGHTLAAVAMHPLETIDCIEISPEVVEVARRYFERSGLDDPRVRLRIGDGRNHLRHSGQKYDVIVSQPSHTWMAGASSLFTRDFFTEMRDHLAPGGIAASWFYAYTDEARRSIVGAFAQAFPAAFLFHNQGIPNLLIGINGEARLSAAAVARATRQPRPRGDLSALQLDDPSKVLAALVAGRERMLQYGAGVPPHTDDNGYVAFHGLGSAVPAPLTPLLQLQEDPLLYIDPTLDTPQQTGAFVARLRAAKRG